MKIQEQLYGIGRASPFLPVQSVNLLVFLVVALIMIFKSVQEVLTDWERTEGVPIKIEQVQERIKEKKPDYFYEIFYIYKVKNKEWSYSIDYSFSSEFMANSSRERAFTNLLKAELWYNKHDPEVVSHEDPTYDWAGYLIAAIISVLIVMYLKWLLLKYYELEIKEH